MVKVLGSGFILCGGVLARYFRLLERRREMDTLSDLLSALRRMTEEIRMARTSLPVLLERLSKGCGPETGAFFHTVADAARRGEDLGQTWGKAVKALPLSPGSAAALAELGAGLRGDEESVRKSISLTIYTLAQEAEERLRRQPEEAKRATALCLSGAALLVILLI